MDYPVFFDQKGTRWRAVKTLFFSLGSILILLSAWVIPQILDPRPVASIENSSTSPPVSPDLIARKISLTNAAVIGEGPLVRVIKVEQQEEASFATDPFSRTKLRMLTDSELGYLDGDNYAIERYGKTEGKRLLLTFDDGPDASYTPQLLDLLSRESAKASFFTLGSSVVKHPDLARRLTQEGHTIANHTFSHANLDFIGNMQAEQEINQTQRIIAAVTGKSTGFFRPPYGGNTDQSLRNALTGILHAQSLGYTVASYDFDSSDWQFTSGLKPEYPEFDGKDITILLHDGGGKREKTLAYVKELIRRAKANGYTFSSLADLYPSVAAPAAPIQQTTPADNVAFKAAEVILVWPSILVQFLFALSIIMISMTSVMNLVLASLHHRQIARGRQRRPKGYRPSVSVIVPAYNEGKVIIKTVESLLRSYYRNIDIIIVDDGSDDDTWQIAQQLASKHYRVKALWQPNGGKSAALNNAISQTESEIVICVDADTIFPPQTITKFVRHFKEKDIGAVAGVVKVGNVSGILTRWQALEYAVSIAIDRNAQAHIGSVMIIPGACGAWRRKAVLEAGGFTHHTLAEDCDLTLKIQKLNKYRILQDNEAISYTEAPQTIRSLVKQRFRWTFGNIQALWQHRSMMDNSNYRWLGMLVMPNAAIGILLPLFFSPILTFVTVRNIMDGNYMIVLIYLCVSLLLQLIIAAIGLRLAKEKVSYLVAVPFARFIYGPIRTYILYKTILTALKGSYVGWNKLVRTGTATYPLATKPSRVSVRSDR